MAMRFGEVRSPSPFFIDILCRVVHLRKDTFVFLPHKKILAVLSLCGKAASCKCDIACLVGVSVCIFKSLCAARLYWVSALPWFSFIDMTPPSPRVVRLEQILPWGSTRAVYDNAVTCFLALRDSWAACPRFHREVAEWLCVYQGVWVGSAYRACTSLVAILICMFFRSWSRLLRTLLVLLCTAMMSRRSASKSPVKLVLLSLLLTGRVAFLTCTRLSRSISLFILRLSVALKLTPWTFMPLVSKIFPILWTMRSVRSAFMHALSLVTNFELVWHHAKFDQDRTEVARERGLLRKRLDTETPQLGRCHHVGCISCF